MTELRSRLITQGIQRSPNRAMLRAVGFGDRDFDKPIVGIANAYSTITPCNLGLDGLAHRAAACGGMFTANPMSSIFGAMGMSLPSSSTMAAEAAEKAESAARSAQVLVDAVRRDLRPRQILTRKAFENAIAVAMAIGGSTNAVLHLLAIARAAGVSLTLDDFEALRPRVPVLCDLKPSGRFVATDLQRSGGI